MIKSWATLNEEGKKLYGEIWPNGEVPIVSIVGIQMQTGPNEPVEDAYLIRKEEMSPEQIEKLLAMLSEKFKTPKEDINKEWETNGLPIRAKFTYEKYIIKFVVN
jgi:hypothetical protein